MRMKQKPFEPASVCVKRAAFGSFKPACNTERLVNEQATKSSKLTHHLCGDERVDCARRSGVRCFERTQLVPDLHSASGTKKRGCCRSIAPR
jgi:hypothetical protein